MKLFSYIFSFYLVLLSVILCCAFDNCPEDKVETAQTTRHQSGDEDDCGACSPFFNCEGCASVSVTPDAIYFTVVPLPAKRIYADFISQLIPDLHYDFWQPPKLG